MKKKRILKIPIEMVSLTTPVTMEMQPTFVNKDICKHNQSHQFFKITDETKTKEENLTRVPIRWGVKVMCVLCGQQRNLWTDGEVEKL